MLDRPLSPVEGFKDTSRGLRGTILRELRDDRLREVSEPAHALLKFHGTYEQYDRDTATALKQSGQDKHWQFMVRARIPGGRMTGPQYLAFDSLADTHGDGSLRITTRQTIQFHGVAKRDLAATIAGIEATLLTTFASCGDVVRNVTTTPAPRRDARHAALEAAAAMLSAALLPRTRAHHAIFVDGEDPGEATAEPEPLYGPTYLPRKFKIGLAHPSDNTPDVLTNDLGFVATGAGEAIEGWILCVGGGLGMTHNKPRTYPRLATPLAWLPAADLLRAAEAVVAFTRDHGDRSDRKRARLKYVVDDLGLDAVRAGVEAHFGAALAPPPPLPALTVPDHLGWHPQGNGRWWLGVPVASGRIRDTESARLRSALRDAVARFGLEVVLTPQQDILLANVAPRDRGALERLLRQAGVTLAEDLTPVARWALACPALPTCGLALTEAERVQGPIVGAIEAALARHGLAQERLSVRITGCPNGCARPYAGDIGLVGRLPGHFALYVGGDFAGTRLSFTLHDRLPQAAIADALDPLFAAFAGDRRDNEGFGDFCHRVGRDALLTLGGGAPTA